MQPKRILPLIAVAGLALFVATALDVHFGGWFSTAFDTRANDAVLRLQDAGFPAGDVGAVLSLPGSGPVDAPLVVLAALFMVALRRWDLAAWTAAVPIAGGRLIDILKEAFQRGFPPGEIRFTTGFGEAASEVRNPDPFIGPAFAFPSGHTLGAVLAIGLAILLPLEGWIRHRRVPDATAWRLRRWALALCALVAVATGVARVLLTVHWTTDVVASWGLAVAMLAGVLAATDWGTSSALDAGRGGRTVRVLGFTGMPGSGKSEAMEVAKQRGIPVVRMGDLIWEEVERRGLPRDAKNVGEVANGMRQTHGPDIWSKRTVEKVRHVARGKSLVIIDGVRSDAEVETFRRELGGDFVLVAIHTDRHHRFERMLARGRADDPKEESILQERDAREIGWGMAQSIALADEMLVNDGGLAQFRANVAALLDRLAGAPR